MVHTFYEALKISVTMAKNRNKRILWYLIIVIGIIALWYGSFWWINKHCGDADGPGTFGDQFGAVNALFTGLSLAGIIITLWMQQQELNAQRREFMNSRATNFLYQQVKLMNNSFNNLTYILIGKQVFTFNGNGAYNVILDDINNIGTTEKDLNVLMNRILAHSQQLLRITSNSVNLMIRLKEIENMSDVDSEFLFESFYFNVDSRIWNLIDKINSVERTGLEPELLEIYRKDIDKIIDFKSIYTNPNLESK